MANQASINDGFCPVAAGCACKAVKGAAHNMAAAHDFRHMLAILDSSAFPCHAFDRRRCTPAGRN
ncbi:hypothetical protein [Salinisphaera hydrothermalis]|uniref:hypothetical protein n=1 Tax=Salinisphaera hydrothermalis TaxID=563188 RepID=UPI00333F1DBC